MAPRIEIAEQGGTEHAIRFLRGIDGQLGVYAQEMVEPARMVPVPVRNDRVIEIPKVKTQRGAVFRECPGTVSGVEENLLSIKVQMRRKTPVLLQERRMAK